MCTPLNVAFNNKIVTVVKCLSYGEGIGLMVATESGLLSLVAILTILVLIVRNVLRKMRNPSPATWRLIEGPADLFMLSLFIADLIQALGGVMNIKWVIGRSVYVGRYCTAQGILQQLGETTVALVTLVIAIHTFTTVWWVRSMRLLSATIIMGIVWLFVVLFVGIGVGLNVNRHYITPTPYWCWIGPNYIHEKLTGEYLWFWITLGVSLFFYVLLSFWSRGNITVHPTIWWKFSVHRSKDSPEESGLRRYSLHLLAYPIIYCIVIIPLSVVRWIEFVQESKGGTNHVAPGWTLAAEIIYRLGGFLNVLLFLLTRRGLLLFRNKPPAGANGQAPLAVPGEYRPMDMLEATNGAHGGGTALGRLPSL